MKTLEQRLQGFKQVKYTRVKRDGSSYAQTEAFALRVLRICTWTYARLESSNQTARLIRDLIDFTLRRYHGYCIKENIGAHYRELGLKPDTKCDFEHVLPAAVARDLLLNGRITVKEALNIPTCIVSKKNHSKLNNQSMASTTPDIYWFWQRYKILGIRVETHDGIEIDTETYNLDHHYEQFKIH